MGIRRQREPEIKKADDKVKPVVNKCWESAKKHGHKPEVWRIEGTWAEVRCAECGMKAGVAVFPPPGAPQFSGDLVTKGCPE